MSPFCSPVCAGRCTVPGGFYGLVTDSLTALPLRETCRSCDGTGIVWRGDDDEPQPAHFHPIIPLAPLPSVTVTMSNAAVLYRNDAYSFTAMQGFVPASHPASSVEPPAITKAREERQSSIDPAYLHGGY